MEMSELNNENLDQISAGGAAGESMTVKDYVKSKPEVLKKVRDYVESHNYEGAIEF